MKRFIVTTGLTLVLLVGLIPTAVAQGKHNWDETRLVNDKFNIFVGGQVVDFRTDVGVGTGVIGTTIRLENDLDIEDNQSTLMLGGFWRFKPKHNLVFGYAAMSRNGLSTIDEEIEFEDVVFVQGELASNFDVDILSTVYQYSFVNNKRTEAGFSAGLSFYQFDIALQGDIEVTEEPAKQVLSEEGAADEGILAPIPTVGLFVRHGLRPNLILSFRANFLNLDIADYLLRVSSTGMSLDWYFSKNVGIGIGTSTSDIQFESTGGDTQWRVAYRQSGFDAHFTFGF